MTTLYKLTDTDMQTYHGYQWTLGKTETASGEGDLCGPGWLHAYTDPLLAVLLNPIHANIRNPRLFRAEGTVGATDHGLKVGCTALALTEELPLPTVSTTQRIAFGILCAKAVCTDVAWNKWADDWLSGRDRSTETAARTAEAVWATETKAKAASWAAWGAAAARARAATADAADAAARAARAADAADAAARAANVDLITLAQQAMEY